MTVNIVLTTVSTVPTFPCFI